MAVVLTPAWETGVLRGAWRARVRAELGDEAAPYLWSDGLLDGWLGEALREYARAGEAAGAWRYTVWGGQLVLDPAPQAAGEPIRVRYLGRRAAPQTDAEALPVAVGEEELLVLYVCARALVWISAQEGKRQAYERERGADALALAGWYEARYRAALRAREQGRAPPRQLVVREG